MTFTWRKLEQNESLLPNISRLNSGNPLDQEVPDVICIGFPKSESEPDLVIEITEDHCLPSILELPNDCNSNLQYQKEQRIDNLQESSTSGYSMITKIDYGITVN
ncbi:hypothetical protein Avbf_08539 [Armadillidium vulgare]|nr:hypothetical protein Avbf_08539 [Armadillidium vulgare]